jgi:hypothetical protein
MPRDSTFVIVSLAFWLMVGVAVSILDCAGCVSLDALESPQTGFSLAAVMGCVIGLLISMPLLIVKGLLLVSFLRIDPSAMTATGIPWMVFSVVLDVGLCLAIGVCFQSLLVPFYLLWREQSQPRK